MKKYLHKNTMKINDLLDWQGYMEKKKVSNLYSLDRSYLIWFEEQSSLVRGLGNDR